uniref:Ribonuclease E n=1 Tax=Cryptomonas sp. SAG 977-2f TaxID=279061 RepID=A0A679CAD3_9CRYP|nr:ribonuclease E [Cryptomonas sp. SAG 977-2f]
MKSKLIIVEKNQVALLYNKHTIINFITEHRIYNVHDIYLGKISRILPSIEAAFITLNESSKNGFIHLENIKLLKKDKTHMSTREVKPRSNDTVIVQIIKEPTGNKGPSLNGDINLMGKYCALQPLKSKAILKIRTERNKSYLRAIESILKPHGMRLSLKSSFKYGDAQFLMKEIKILKTYWKKILRKSKKLNSPYLLSRKKNFIIKVLEYIYQEDFDHVAIDSAEGASKLKTIFNTLYTGYKKSIKIEFYKTNLFLINYYSLDLVIAHILKPRVNLAHGGYIVIEKTEALTTIDVNSGSFTNLNNARETILWTNYCAAIEILKQIKLRNLGGIIVIDFIDSNNQEDQMKILVYLTKLMKNDRVFCNVVQVSELGLVEIIRTRQGQNVYDAFSRRCNSCDGLGYCLKTLVKKNEKKSSLLVNLTPSFSCNFIQSLKFLCNLI